MGKGKGKESHPGKPVSGSELSGTGGPGATATFPEASRKSVGQKNVQFHKKIDRAARQLRQEGVVQLTQRSGERDHHVTSFPSRLLASDPEQDTMQMAKRKYAEEMSGGGGGAPVYRTVTDTDAAWLMNREMQRTRMNFDEWFANQLDMDDINKLMLAQEIHPDFFDEKEKFIEEQAQIQTRLAKIKLRGPRTKEDMEFIWLFTNGAYPGLDKPVHKLDEPTTAYFPKNAYKPGVFSPMRVVFSEESNKNDMGGWGISALKGKPTQNFAPAFGGRFNITGYPRSRGWSAQSIQAASTNAMSGTRGWGDKYLDE